jgi:molybdate transport system substrate-binding protein
MRLTRRLGRALAVALALVLAAVGPSEAQELTLSVAISMKEAVEEVGRVFAESHPGVVLRYNFGASGELQKQIEAGAPIDVFISAAQRQMDELETRGLLLPGTRRSFARNVLVVVVPADAAPDLKTPADLLASRVGRIAIGNPRTVPAGQYAEACLRALGLWERLAPRLILSENVRQVLQYVARGEVDAGFVYATDAASRPGPVREAFRPPEATYGPVIYPAAVLTATRHAALARDFVERLVSDDGLRRLVRFGFLPPPRP